MAKGKKKKDPNKPKRAKTAYTFFTSDPVRREEAKAKKPDAKSKEIFGLLAEAWQKLTDEEKKPYVAKAEADKKRAAAAMADYKPPTSESSSSSDSSGKPKKKKRKKAKDPNAPKRATTAYQAFCAAHRPTVKEKFPDIRQPDVFKKLGEMWNKCNEEDRKKFEAIAEKDKVRYEEENKAYKEKKKAETSSDSSSSSKKKKKKKGAKKAGKKGKQAKLDFSKKRKKSSSTSSSKSSSASSSS